MVVTRSLALLFATSALLAACADDARREFIYKPAYCLAGGLANIGSEACLPEALKEKAVAVATAKLKDAAAETPSEDLRVYYTDDQRMAMSYAIARSLFAPNDTLTTDSVTMSLEASNLIEPLPATTACRADKARADVVKFVRSQISDHTVNRDTADFLAEHYTDLQLTELYRVAKEGGKLTDVKDDAFIMPDPKRPGTTINVKPKGGSTLGGILSFSTSRVASRMVDERRAHIEAVLKERTHIRRQQAARKDPACAEEPAEPAATPATTEAKE